MTETTAAEGPSRCVRWRKEEEGHGRTTACAEGQVDMNYNRLTCADGHRNRSLGTVAR